MKGALHDHLEKIEDALAAKAKEIVEEPGVTANHVMYRFMLEMQQRMDEMNEALKELQCRRRKTAPGRPAQAESRAR
jgi:hypothetical protein